MIVKGPFAITQLDSHKFARKHLKLLKIIVDNNTQKSKGTLYCNINHSQKLSNISHYLKVEIMQKAAEDCSRQTCPEGLMSKHLCSETVNSCSEGFVHMASNCIL